METDSCTELTQMVLEYQHMQKQQELNEDTDEHAGLTNDLFRRIISRCEHQIYHYPLKVHILDPDDASDFLLKFMPRLHGIVRHYSYTRVSFESYLRRLIFLQATTYNQRKHIHDHRFGIDMIDPQVLERTVIDRSSHPQPYAAPDYWGSVSEDSPAYWDHSDSTWDLENKVCREFLRKMKKSPTIKKRFYELALLCSSSLNAAQVKLIASCLDIDEYELATKMTQLHETGYRRIEISEHLEGTRDLHFMRLMELERRLATSMYYDDQEHKESIRKRIVRERRHLSERQTELRTRPGSVTHAMVAQIVGVPKGTIDSGMSALKKIVQRIVDDRT